MSKYYQISVKIKKHDDRYNLGPYSTLEKARVVGEAHAHERFGKGNFEFDGCAWRRGEDSMCIIGKQMDTDYAHYAQILHDIKNGTGPVIVNK